MGMQKTYRDKCVCPYCTNVFFNGRRVTLAGTWVYVQCPLCTKRFHKTALEPDNNGGCIVPDTD